MNPLSLKKRFAACTSTRRVTTSMQHSAAVATVAPYSICSAPTGGCMQSIAIPRRYAPGGACSSTIQGSRSSTPIFRRLGQVLEEKGWVGRTAGVLFDLGVSLPQFTAPKRGFSLRSEGPLDMRMNPDEGRSAAEWLNGAARGDIARVLRRFGEEPHARRIANAICHNRPVSRCSELARIVSSVVHPQKPGIHPATRTFMAVRIFINNELEALEEALPQAVLGLRSGGRLCVISFHSLEDRIVKRYMRNASRLPPALARLPVVPPAAGPLLRVVGRMQRCSSQESSRNPRARSARLRVAERRVGKPQA